MTWSFVTHIYLQLTNFLSLLAIHTIYQLTTYLLWIAYYNIRHLPKSSRKYVPPTIPLIHRGLLAFSPTSTWRPIEEYIGGFIVAGFFWEFLQPLNFNQLCLRRTVGHNHILFFSPNGETPRVQTLVPTMPSYPLLSLWWAIPSPSLFPHTSPTNHITTTTGSLIKLRHNEWHRDPCNWYCTYWIRWKQWIGADHLHARIIWN